MDRQQQSNRVECRCDYVGFCPVHGGYNPVILHPDLAVSLTIYRCASKVKQVVRKKLGGDNYGGRR